MEQDYKQKKYYSLNLTEGRILVIFIFIILFITIITFCITFLFFNRNKANELKLKNMEASNSQLNINPDNSIADYSSVQGSEENLFNESSVEEESKAASEKSDEKIAVEPNEEEDQKTIQKEIIEKENNDVIKKDYSEIIYSSKYNESAPKTVKKTEVKKSENKTGAVKTKKYDTRYIVQIGSYSSKKTAESISTFYKDKGYSSFIVTKDHNGKTFFRLRIGPFKEKDQALKYLNEIKKVKHGENSYLSVVYI